MTCLNERLVGASFFMLSEFAFAGSLVTDAPEVMTLTNISPMPMEVLAPIPEPQRYVQRYVMQYQSDRRASNDAQVPNFYSVDVAPEFRYRAADASPAPQSSTQQVASYLQLHSATSQLSLIDVPNATLTLKAQPQRRLSLTVDQWVFSATARIAIFHSHSTGATVTVRRGF
jgi:hypothetical protein